MRRRNLIALLGSAAVAWPFAARTEGEHTRRIAVLEGFDDAEGRTRRSAFQAELERLGWTDGLNIRLDYRWGQGDAERIRAYATELVSLNSGKTAGPATNACAQLARRRDLSGIGFVLPKISFDCRLN